MGKTSTNKQPANSTSIGSDDVMLNSNIFAGTEAMFETFQEPNKAVYAGITGLSCLNRSQKILESILHDYYMILNTLHTHQNFRI